MEKGNFFWIAIFFIALCFTGCGKEKGEIAKIAGRESPPEQIIENFTLTHTTGGEKEWELEADRAEIFREEGRTTVKKLRLTFYSQAKIASILTAREGELNSQSGDMEVKGDVTVTSEDEGTTLKTESLRWDARQKKIVTDDLVRQEKADTVITGKGLESDPGLRKLVIKKNVRVIRMSR